MADRWAQAAAQQTSMVEHRRALHREPEVGLELPDTHTYLADALRGLGLEPEVHHTSSTMWPTSTVCEQPRAAAPRLSP